MSEGTILVNDAQTPGNATVFSGTTLQTQRASSQVRLKDGAQVRFDSDSRGKISDHGPATGQCENLDFFRRMPAGSKNSGDDSSANVTLKGNVVEVANSEFAGRSLVTQNQILRLFFRQRKKQQAGFRLGSSLFGQNLLLQGVQRRV